LQRADLQEELLGFFFSCFCGFQFLISVPSHFFLQQFHDCWLAHQVCPWPRTSPSHSPLNQDLAQRLEAKLSAAEQRRAELLAQEQMQLANLHELRVAVKAEAQLQSEHEREELGCKVEFENAPSRHQETGTAGGRKATARSST
jgi:hypothetical protein